MPFFTTIEDITVPIFTAEYVLRLLTVHAVSFKDLKVSRAEVPHSPHSWI